MSIIAQIKAAKEEFCGWDWTMEFGSEKGYPQYWDSRPDAADKRDGAADAREYADSVDAAAEACRDLADSAIAAIERGDLDAAIASMAEAARLEGEYGECPSYGGIADDLGDFREYSDPVIVERMPEGLRASRRAAGNWGVYPHNGAERIVMRRNDVDDDEYDHIVRSATLSDFAWHEVE